MQTWEYQNPILRGFRPDPSICRVGSDFYLVNSTFEYFPGVPVFHSRDLINWEQAGACLTHASQVPLTRCRPSGGIFAATLRYNGGRFYMITTNNTGGGNFIVSTDDIRGEWSQPHWIDQKGIDPSLLFDGGRAYYCGTGEDENGKQGIVLFEIDPETGAVKGDKKIISYGYTGKNPEGPHIYKINGWYYLMMAEGGTEYGHMETIFRSADIRGPYEACPRNPILTNRYEMDGLIDCCGHADITDDENGNWWLVCLGTRRLSARLMMHNLGRETFLAPVTWSADGWPQVGGNGTIHDTMSGPLPCGGCVRRSGDISDDFTSSRLAPYWTFLRNPVEENYKTGGGKLRIKGTDESLDDFAPSFAGVRQTEHEMKAQVTVSAKLEAQGAKAGITAYYTRDAHYDLCLERRDGRLWAVLSRRIMDIEAVTGMLCLEGAQDKVTLEIETGRDKYVFRAAGRIVGTGCAAGLCTECSPTMTFTGTFIGLFAVGDEAEFSSFRLTACRDGTK